MTKEVEQKERLDKNLCPHCGARLRVKALAHDDIVISKWRYCEKVGCGWDARSPQANAGGDNG